MFPDIVQDLGRLIADDGRSGAVRKVFAFERPDPAGPHVGGSICVQGGRLNVTQPRGREFAADVSRETTSLSRLWAR